MALRPSRPSDLETLFDVWLRAVEATHAFLSVDDVEEFSTIVRERYLPQHEFTVVVDDDDHPYAFMGMTGSNVDSLFVDPERHRTGAGRALIEHARKLHPGGLTVDVNEDNGQAIAFYERMGFRTTRRSPVDGLGKPYPILHMEWR